MANEQIAGNKNDTVIVGCKLANGYIMELIPKPNDGWNPPPAGPRVTLKGANSVPSDSPIHVNPRILGYGRTIVSREFWDRWLAANKDREVVANGFIFAEAKEADFKARAREGLPEKTGLEGLSPDGKDDRLRKIQVPGHPETAVETDAQHLKRLQDSIDRAA
jgi:hypothetical protein